MVHVHLRMEDITPEDINWRISTFEQTAFRRDIKDNGYTCKSVFTNLWMERQRNRSWIRDLRVNSLLTAVPFVRGHQSVFPRTRRNTCVYARHPMFVTATSAMLTRLPAKFFKKRNAR